MHREEKELVSRYDTVAELYFSSRTDDAQGLNGLQNRELEQPTMFSLVPKDLQGKKLLDVGCGPGIHVKEYASRGADTFGVDPSEELIRIAQQQEPSASFSVASAYELPFADETFDMLTSSLAFDHVKDMTKGVAELHRVLKKNGCLFFSIPHPITYMFRKPKDMGLKVSDSYFSNDVTFLNIVRSGKKFIVYPRTLQEYFDCFLKQGFSLVKFIEGKLAASLLEKYTTFPTDLLMIPPMAFFVWEKR